MVSHNGFVDGFVNKTTVLTQPSWCASIVVVSWIVSQDHHERVAGRYATTVLCTVFDNKTMDPTKLPWQRRGVEMVWLHHGRCRRKAC